MDLVQPLTTVRAETGKSTNANTYVFYMQTSFVRYENIVHEQA